MKKYISLFISLLVLTALCGCSDGKTSKPEEAQSTTTENITTTVPVHSTTEAEVTQNTTQASATEKKETTTEKKEEKPASTTKKEAPPETEQASYEKTGEMAYSDSADNRYINAVSSKYSVDSSLLVALYTVPENDSNIVLQFNGTTNANGEIIKNEDTLTAIYTVDKALNSKCASEDRSRNEYPYGEMKVIYFSTTKYIMPEFPQLMMSN